MIRRLTTAGLMLALAAFCAGCGCGHSFTRSTSPPCCPPGGPGIAPPPPPASSSFPPPGHGVSVRP